MGLPGRRGGPGREQGGGSGGDRVVGGSAFVAQHVVDDVVAGGEEGAPGEHFEGERAAVGEVGVEVGVEGVDEFAIEDGEVDLVVEGEGAVVEVG